MNFILTTISEDIFFEYAGYDRMGDRFIETWQPEFYEWMKENEIHYKIHFEYNSPSVLAYAITVRLEVASEEDAVLLRLKWS